MLMIFKYMHSEYCQNDQLMLCANNIRNWLSHNNLLIALQLCS